MHSSTIQRLGRLSRLTSSCNMRSVSVSTNTSTVKIAIRKSIFDTPSQRFSTFNPTGNFTPVTHVIFDMDGILLDTEPRYRRASEIICERFGSKYTDEAKLAALGRNAKDGAAAVIKICKLPITVDEFLEQVDLVYLKVFDGVQQMPGAERLVRHLETNSIPIAIATSSKKTTFGLKTADHKDMFKPFHHIVFGTDPELKNGKPAPDIYQIAASRFRVPPKDPKHVLVFEDSIAGVKAGLAAGMQVVWVPDDLLDVNSQEATVVIKTLMNFDPEQFNLPKFNDPVNK